MSIARTNARKCAVQALYQWQMTGANLNDIEQHFLEEQLLKGAQRTYFDEVFRGVPKQLDVIDQHLSEFVDRPVNAIDPVERAVLRIGTYELLFRLETPYRVIINEGINLAKCFGAEGSHRYINGILDKVAQKVRAVEIAAKTAKDQES